MKWEKHESGDMSKWCSEVCGMGETPTPWLTRRPSWAKADSAVLCWAHVCVCIYVAADITQYPSPPLAIPSFSRSLSLHLYLCSTSFLPVPARETRILSAFLPAGSPPASFCASCVFSSPSSLCLPPPPMGFVGQPGYLTIPAAVKGVERTDTTLLPWCRSASLLLYAFRLTLCFAG